MAPSLLLPCLVHECSPGPHAKILSQCSLLKPSPAFESWREAGAIHRGCRPEPPLPSLLCSWAFEGRGICLPSPVPAARGQGGRNCGGSVVMRGVKTATEIPFGFPRQHGVSWCGPGRPGSLLCGLSRNSEGPCLRPCTPPGLALQASQRLIEILKILECIAFLFKYLELVYIACKRISLSMC